MESERKSTNKKRKVIHIGSRSKDFPSPLHILDTTKANPFLVKSLEEDITSPMKDVSKGRGKKGCHYHC